MSLIPVGRVISAAGFVTSLGGGALSAPSGRRWTRPPRARGAPTTCRRGQARSSPSHRRRGRLGHRRRRRGTDARRRGMHRADAPRRPSTRCPTPTGWPAEIIVQRGHRNAYDRAFRTAGARIVEVGYPWIEGVGLTYEWQLEAAFSERTVAVGHLALAEATACRSRRVCELAAAHGVPVIVDAAAELPPSSNLRRFIDEGAALVVFSGGKAIRGPQGSGILAGRRDLIESVRLQTLDMDVDVECVDRARGRRAAASRARPQHEGRQGADRRCSRPLCASSRPRPRGRGGRARRLAREPAASAPALAELPCAAISTSTPARGRAGAGTARALARAARRRRRLPIVVPHAPLGARRARHLPRGDHRR